MNNDILIKRLAKTLSEVQTKKTSPYDTQAEVRRVDGDVAWVHIPGGVEETPVQLTASAKKGDVVQVRVSGGRAWLYGNVTSPPTDDTSANEAKKTAASASEHAINAVTEAGIAKEAADSAQASAATAKAVTDEIEGYAQTVSKTVTQVLEDGETAGIAAQQASEAATSALKGLSTVEDVVDTLNWIATHCKYEKTTDMTIVTGKAYYTVTATQVSSPTDEDIVTYYELVSGEYVKTTDTSVVSGKTYYTVVGEPVTNPVVADIGTYYELEITEAVSNYINTHVAVTDEGLWLIPNNTQGSNKVLIAVGGQGHTYGDAGTYILDGSDNVLAKFLASGAVIGENANGKSRTKVGTDGMQIIKKDGGNDVQIAHLGYGSGTDSGGGTSDAPYYTLGLRRGNDIGNYSLAEGAGTEASAYTSHAEGSVTTASGSYSHAEGSASEASGIASHAEGLHTIARGNYSHASGSGTISSGRYRTVIGKYNADDLVTEAFIGDGVTDTFVCAGSQQYETNVTVDGTRVSFTISGNSFTIIDGAPEDGAIIELTYVTTQNLFVIGNGTSDSSRSNALTVDENGDIEDGNGYSFIKCISSTDNGWRYRKYPDGTYEAWRTITLSVARQTTYGALYRSLEQSVTLPSFNSGTSYQLIGSSNGGDWLLFNTFNETTASYFFVRTSSASASSKVARLYIHGTYS